MRYTKRYTKKLFLKDALFILVVVMTTIGLLALVDDTEGEDWTRNQVENAK